MIGTYVQWLAMRIITGTVITMVSIVGLFLYLTVLAFKGGDEPRRQEIRRTFRY